MIHPWFERPSPRVLAHRGLIPADADGIAENSFAAVAAAHAAGAAYIESDCHLTADGEVVLFHDADLSRVIGDPRPVSRVPLAELERLMAGIGGLISLRQALEAFPDVRFNLDIKSEAAAVPVGRIVAPHAERVLLASFSDVRRRTALEAADRFGRGMRPATSAGTATIGRVVSAMAMRSRPLVRRALAGVDALQVPERQGAVRIVSPRLIDAAHACGVEVHVWTVNDPLHMARLLDLGVDGLVTDRADVALREVAKRR
ncbi:MULTISPECIES: glycerophosphodiester phosphodiesterase family protein [unclassified Microbacterium]|uniref:glycerophosphodiester phosphodiesterase family protein n=1 Tax=unclassified Microbacterium TaxID=2609290 RepID=UPI00214AC24F|nr:MULTISPECIES: glycerophosphodiester phosphodiesterase family protein [unclassified Microbacterium]MCR2785745.1 glycerophosphodiester phosphodiesterase [Microbacterium sp. zg.B96]WIM17271.1 glycerophosphodiester phosphodiesterase family protein [Microbacterium sp. zg-B96]